MFNSTAAEFDPSGDCRGALRAARAKITIEIMLTSPFFRKPFALHHGLQQ
jgi:hypothetical protein